ncbi:MAG: hypothetical protein Q9Q40_08430 [Acidobacteriota bacterium]|nr:hypothetical protein [Acidobacteriota bacterium]MDQ7086331.1 hypothetical protein [Acidobacteriota bacterium]
MGQHGPCLAQVDDEPDNINFFDISGSADWELYRSASTSAATSASSRAFRQKYSLDLAGSIWDYRFARYNLGLDMFRTDRSATSGAEDSDTLGYRAAVTFFPARSFPLRLHARKSTTDVAALSLASSDRQTASWGAEWSLNLRGDQNIRAQYDRSSYDLTSPVSLAERRRHTLLEYRNRGRNNDFTVRYSGSRQEELLLGSLFDRKDFSLSERRRFSDDSTLITTVFHTLSDARFSTGQTDSLTIQRVSTVYDHPRRDRFGWNVSYDYSSNDGRFVDSTSHHLRFATRVRAGTHWEITNQLSGGRLDTRTRDGERGEDLLGGGLGARFHGRVGGASVSGSVGIGVTKTRFGDGEERRLSHFNLGGDFRLPLGAAMDFFAEASYSNDENDVTGVGYSLDEVRATVGLEGGIRRGLRGRAAVFYVDRNRDTFDFGLQNSRETGLEASLSGHRGGLTVTYSQRDGVSDFIPDPAGGSPFLPGNDLVNRADVLVVGGHCRLRSRLSLRLQARVEDRTFSSIGDERIVSWHPEVEWSYAVWRFSAGYAHYSRDNSTSFSDDTWLIRISRRFS